MTGKEHQSHLTEIIAKRDPARTPENDEKKTATVLDAVSLRPDLLDETYLESLSEEALIDILVMVSRMLKKKHHTTTERITQDEDPIIFREYSEIAPGDFITLPAEAAPGPISESGTWYVVLVSHDPSHKPLPLKLEGDVILGRAVEDVTPDIDLTPYDADRLGVSREHAKIRVTRDQLILADLGSTNGTFYLDDKLSLGKTAIIADQGVVTLGKLHFKINIVRKPNDEK